MASQAQATQPSPIEFKGSTQAAGIKFTHFKGNVGTSINREEFGPGVCVADFDGDGWPDIYFVNGRDLYNRGVPVRNALYRNNGDGTFSDVTEKAGVAGAKLKVAAAIFRRAISAPTSAWEKRLVRKLLRSSGPWVSNKPSAT